MLVLRGTREPLFNISSSKFFIVTGAVLLAATSGTFLLSAFVLGH